jgi:branched-chain amino acid transport system permease protein
VLGGMGSIPGVIVGAFALIGTPELLREFAEYKLLVYGAVLVAVMILRPEGLIPDASRRGELEDARHEEGELQVEYDEISADA